MAIIPESDGNFSMQINNIASKVLFSNWSTLTLTSDFAFTAPTLNATTINSTTTNATTLQAVNTDTYRNKIQMSNLFINASVQSTDIIAQYVGFAHPTQSLSSSSKYFSISPLTNGDVGFGINNISGYFLYTEFASSRVTSEYTFGFRTAPFSSGYRYQTFLNNVTEIGSVSMLTGSTIAFNTSSDYRLKQDIIPIQNPLERLMKLKPKNYRFIADVQNELCCECYFDGFLAHEIQEVIPMIVTGEKDDPNQMQQLDYSKLTPILTGAVQELKNEVDSMKLIIDTQQKMIDLLMIRLEILENK
jgi:hypothetical protein